MQELTFEQVEVVSGGGKIDDMRRRQAEREVQDHTINSSDGGGVNNLGAQTVIVGVGAALGAINPWLGVAGAMYSYYVVSTPSSGGSPSYPSYQGGPHQLDPLL